MKKIREVTIEEILVFTFPVFYIETKYVSKPIKSYRINTSGELQFWSTFSDTWRSISRDNSIELKEIQKEMGDVSFFIIEEEDYE